MRAEAAKRPRRRAKQERARATVDAILEAAARVLTEEGYAALTRDILDLSREAPVLSLLEGGYNLEALADSVATHLTTLLDA